MRHSLLLFFLIFLALLLAMPLMVAAQVTTIPTVSPISSITEIELLLRDILDWIFIFVGIIAVIMILYSAALFMFSGGSETTREKAKNYLKWGIVGVAVAILAGSIIAFVFNVLLGI